VSTASYRRSAVLAGITLSEDVGLHLMTMFVQRDVHVLLHTDGPRGREVSRLYLTSIIYIYIIL
jgi:hypothetical protein